MNHQQISSSVGFLPKSLPSVFPALISLSNPYEFLTSSDFFKDSFPNTYRRDFLKESLLNPFTLWRLYRIPSNCFPALNSLRNNHCQRWFPWAILTTLPSFKWFKTFLLKPLRSFIIFRNPHQILPSIDLFALISSKSLQNTSQHSFPVSSIDFLKEASLNIAQPWFP